MASEFEFDEFDEVQEEPNSFEEIPVEVLIRFMLNQLLIDIRK